LLPTKCRANATMAGSDIRPLCASIGTASKTIECLDPGSDAHVMALAVASP
jgi:hypothetical protein